MVANVSGKRDCRILKVDKIVSAVGKVYERVGQAKFVGSDLQTRQYDVTRAGLAGRQTFYESMGVH